MDLVEYVEPDQYSGKKGKHELVGACNLSSDVFAPRL
jgi:hypothetical protein